MAVWGWIAVCAAVFASGVAMITGRPAHLVFSRPWFSRDATASIAATLIIGVAIGAVFTGDDGTTPTALAVGGMLLLGLVYLGPRLKSFKIKDIEVVLQDLATKAIDAEDSGNDEAAQQLRAEIARLVTLLAQPEHVRTRSFGTRAPVDFQHAEEAVLSLLQRSAPLGSEIWRDRGGKANGADFGVVRQSSVVAVEVRLGLNFRPEDLARLFRATAASAGGDQELNLRGAILFVPEGRVNESNRVQLRVQQLLNCPLRILEITDDVQEDLAEILAGMLLR